ncbi:MAG: hypothetical protein EG826_02090 [Deltaproteobacteria bacterium]|nr:hypothetical protein [Deltaproteobacteria bacterium]
MMMRRLMLPVFLLLLLTACSNSPPPASCPTCSAEKGLISGTVVGPWNNTYGSSLNPISGVAVNLTGGDAPYVFVKTDANGYFELSLPAGLHHLRLSKSGLRTLDLDVSVSPGGTTTVTTPGDINIIMHAGGEQTARWTVMYYMAVSNSLYDNTVSFWHGAAGQLGGMYDFNRTTVAANQLQEGINIVIFYDQQIHDPPHVVPGREESPYYKPKGTYLTTISKVNGKINFKTIPWKMGAAGIDSGSADTLREFVRMASYHYPAEKFMLVMYDHGFGINGLCESHANGKYSKIFLHEFGRAMRDLTAVQPIEIVAFDNCMMGMFEVAYEFKGSNVNFMVAGETELLNYNLPVGGYFTTFWDKYCDENDHCGKYQYQYQGDFVIKWLTNITDREPRETARLLAYEADAAQYEMFPPDQNGNPMGREVYVAVDLKEFLKNRKDNGADGTAELFKNLAVKLRTAYKGFTDGSGFASFVGEAKVKTQNLSGPVNGYFREDPGNPFETKNYRDLKHFCANLSVLSEQRDYASLIKNEADALSASLESGGLTNLAAAKSILYSSRINPAYGTFSGLSVLLTTGLHSLTPNYYRDQYQNLQIYKDCPDMWDFLREANIDSIW